MPRRRPPYLRQERTRHGRMIWTFRRDKEYRRLPDEYGSDAFWAAYNAALEGKQPDKPASAQSGTLAWLVTRYKQSGHFTSLAPSSRMARDYIMQAVCKDSGRVQFARITRKHIQEALDRRSATPHAANNFLVAMSVLFRWAVQNEMVATNPCDGVDPIKTKSTGFHTWTLEQVEQYRARHPVGTKARLALDLFLFTGLRLSDAMVVGKQHIRDGMLSIRTRKTGAGVTVPIFPELQASIDAAPTGDLALLTTKHGRPFGSPSALGVWFGKRCDEAGLPDICTAHGLRKAGATIAANNGASAHELMAMFGWSKLAMAEAYTKTADKARLARAAAERIANNASSYLISGATISRKK